MKFSNIKIKTTAWVAGFLFALFPFASINAQCTGNVIYTAVAPAVVGSTVTTSCVFTGEGVSISGLMTGATYQFDNCNAGTFDSELSLYDVGQVNLLAFNDDFCGLNSGIVYTALSSADVELILTELGCATNGVCSEIDITLVALPITNDIPCDAEAIPLNTLVTYSTLGGTVDANEAIITPGLNNCLTEWCDAVGIDGSVWFSFVAPASGFVEISACNAGTTFDTQLALYSVSDCNDYNTFTLLAANDDGTGCTGFASYLQVACLTPGTTYYLLVDGYSGDAGDVELAINDLPASPPSVVTSATAPPCPGDPGMATAVATGIAPFTYSWSNNATTQSVSALPGTLSVQITDACGNISATSTVTIPSSPALIVDAGADQSLCSGESVSIGGNGAIGGNPIDGNITGYGYDALSGSLVKFPISDPTATTQIGATLAIDLFAGDFTPNGFLGLVYGTNTLVMLDTVTGTSTSIGSSIPITGQDWTGLAWNSTNNTLYATSTDISNSQLYTINPTTGAATSVGPMGVAGAIWLAINNAGQAYTLDIVTDNLYSVNLSTGSATLIGPIGFDANYIQDADFDPMTGILYLAAYNNLTALGELRSADLVTGVTTYLGDLGVGGAMEISAFGVVNSGSNSYTYQWSPATGLSDPNILNPTASPISTTTYVLTVTDECGTSVTDAVTVTVNPSPIVNLGADIFACSPNQNTLVAGTSPNDTYSWCNGATTPSIIVNTSGTYCVTVTNSMGCSASDTILVTYNTPPTADAGADAGVCSGNSVTLNASATGGGTYTYSWNTGQTGSSITVSPTGTTIYTVTALDTNGCSDSDDVTVTVNSAPTADAGQDDGICSGSSAVLTGSGQGGSGTLSYSWSNGVSGASQTVTPTATTTYTLTVSDANGCTGTDDIMVTVNQAPVANAGNDIAICEGGSAQLNGSAQGGSTQFTFSWNNGVSGPNQTVTPASTTTYTLTAIDVNGCSGTDNVTVTVNPQPATPNFTVNTATGVLTSSAPAGNQWYLNGNVIAGATSSTYTATTDGSYHVCVTNPQGCTACATPQNVILSSIGSGAFIVPVTIQPNPVKDYLKIIGDDASVEEYIITIYNALGQVVYEHIMDKNRLEITTSGWAAGVYSVQFIKDGKFVGVAKVVKE